MSTRTSKPAVTQTSLIPSNQAVGLVLLPGGAYLFRHGIESFLEHPCIGNGLEAGIGAVGVVQGFACAGMAGFNLATGYQ